MMIRPTARPAEAKPHAAASPFTPTDLDIGVAASPERFSWIVRSITVGDALRDALLEDLGDPTWGEPEWLPLARRADWHYRALRLGRDAPVRDLIQHFDNIAALMARAAGLLDGRTPETVLRDLADLHDRKSKDYGADGDPYANVRASEAWGFPAWVGCMMRAGDKVIRMRAAATRGKLANEPLLDAFLDMAVYSIIGRMLLEETAR